MPSGKSSSIYGVLCTMLYAEIGFKIATVYPFERQGSLLHNASLRLEKF
ncbi:unnamed protein product [Penicillium camemberti]|uniref:Str. FM013 n=1 Tax=Penicillium camemberti (strain FM 013) TaxID=1429867 RepID=A0A0G4PP31_PENC3|nr:unnamed protein product [Penicillium camemberti]